MSCAILDLYKCLLYCKLTFAVCKHSHAKIEYYSKKGTRRRVPLFNIYYLFTSLSWVVRGWVVMSFSKA